MPYDITYMWNLKYDTNEPIYKIETDSQTQKTNQWLQRGERQLRGMRVTDTNYYTQNT